MSEIAYNESSIRVLKGLEPVRARPAMYTRTDSPTHIIAEVIDNAADEALAGFATAISVTLHADGSVSVVDNGRGIPTGIHPVELRPTVEVVFTHLHAGGKFDKQHGGAYTFSGGLHGVGVSVTNALSTRLEVTVVRDGIAHRIVFANGEVILPLAELGPSRERGTTIRVWPDPRYFESAAINRNELAHLLRAKAVLTPHLEVRLIDEAGSPPSESNWCYSDGMRSYLAEQLLDDDDVSPIIAFERRFAADEHPSFAEGEGAALALAFVEGGSGFSESYVNMIPTALGGTHESGLKNGIFESLHEFIEHHALLPGKLTLQSEDIWRHVRFVLSAKLLDPQFQGQTKDKLNNREAVKLVAQCVKDPLDTWFNVNLDWGKRIAQWAIASAQQRQKNARAVERKRSSSSVVLPGKLTDCESQSIDENELFLVEGDSAGGSAKQGRNRLTQAILPLRGKILNAWEIPSNEILANHEIHDLAVALGVDPHRADVGPEILAELRYGKVIIMADADVDGSHIQTLLLTLFLRHFPQLVVHGHVYIAQPPLYAIRVEAQGKKRPERRLYALDEREREHLLQALTDEGVKPQHIGVGRFKGLGEMNPDELRETTMHPDTRRLLPMHIAQAKLKALTPLFSLLMGKNEAANRRAWMEQNAHRIVTDV